MPARRRDHVLHGLAQAEERRRLRATEKNGFDVFVTGDIAGLLVRWTQTARARGGVVAEIDHQTVWMLEARIRPSRLMAGTPKYNAVAATMRSGISGISTRGTSRMASMISAVTGASWST